MAAGIFNPGVIRTDAPQEFDGLISANAGLTTTGAVTHGGPVTFNGVTSLGSANIGAALSTWGPQDVGLLAWVAEPGLITGTAISIATRIYLIGVQIRQTTLISNLWCHINVAATTPTTGQNFLGVYNQAGTLVAVTADISTSTTPAGIKTLPVTTPFSAPAGLYWVALLFNAGTNPTLSTLGTANGIANLSNTATSLRYAVNGTGTTLPSSITPASNTATASLNYWVGIS